MESRYGPEKQQGAISHILTIVVGLTIRQTGKKRVLFDAEKDGQNISPKWVPAIENQELNESRR
jgi:hypothetical protein